MTYETPRGDILREAGELIHGDRNASYGSPVGNFENTAALWNVQIGHKLKEPLTAADVASLMIQLKMARLIATPKRDNYADIIGYAACGWECVEVNNADQDAVGADGAAVFDSNGNSWRYDVSRDEWVRDLIRKGFA